MSLSLAPPVPGHIGYATARLVDLERTVAVDGLAPLSIIPSGWRPRQPDPPYLYNWVSPSTLEWKDVSGHRRMTHLALSTRIGVRYSDVDEQMVALVAYADAFLDTVDPVFRGQRPMANAAKWADIQTVTLVTDSWGEGQDFLAFEFALLLDLERILPT